MIVFAYVESVFFCTSVVYSSLGTRHNVCLSILYYFSSLIVNGAKTDAIDFDFSNLEIDYINVSNALNDCVDMSFGNYLIKNQLLQDCGDKAISVGENSVFNGNKIEIKDSEKLEWHRLSWQCH